MISACRRTSLNSTLIFFSLQFFINEILINIMVPAWRMQIILWRPCRRHPSFKLKLLITELWASSFNWRGVQFVSRHFNKMILSTLSSWIPWRPYFIAHFTFLSHQDGDRRCQLIQCHHQSFVPKLMKCFHIHRARKRLAKNEISWVLTRVLTYEIWNFWNIYLVV